MEGFSGEGFAIILALIGVVIMIAALISGLIERSNLPQVAVFLALGAVLGPPGLGIVNITLDSPVLRVVATLSLTLVLFTDALSLNIREVRKQLGLTLLVLGPGTLLSATLIAAAGWWLLGLPLAGAVVVGAALASTDPVLLRGFLRRRDIPSTARQALRLESGLNDVVLLPIVLVAMTFLGNADGSGSTAEHTDWARLAIDLLLLGPGAGVLIGLLAVATLDLVRRRIGIRRDYESLYSLGVAFAAFAAAEAVHGSGFLAAFAAGLTIAALDVELCDCFLEYGETTAEMALLFTFVLFGSSLIWSAFTVWSLAAAVFAVLVLVVRPLAFSLALARTRLPGYDKVLISWFGPRGLSTLLLVLLPVFAGVEGGAQMFAICSLVVLLSVVVHGGTLMLVGKGRRGGSASQGSTTPSAVGEVVPLSRIAGPAAADTIGPDGIAGDGVVGSLVPPDGRADGIVDGAQPPEEDSEAEEQDRISVAQLRMLQQESQPVVVVDARTERTFDGSELQAPGAVRILPGAGGTAPGSIVDQAMQSGIPRGAWVAVFCA
ncbi:MAG: cation:proton antiporter [Chloroflexota bacterium]|nr:cation:proton antiporter [Chloroflexota bacterium]MDQ5866516.1 cation:proton antiporter [Chloroflexota bacterium]